MKILCLYGNECALELFEWMKNLGHKVVLWKEKLFPALCQKCPHAFLWLSLPLPSPPGYFDVNTGFCTSPDAPLPSMDGVIKNTGTGQSGIHQFYWEPWICMA